MRYAIAWTAEEAVMSEQVDPPEGYVGAAEQALPGLYG